MLLVCCFTVLGGFAQDSSSHVNDSRIRLISGTKYAVNGTTFHASKLGPFFMTNPDAMKEYNQYLKYSRRANIFGPLMVVGAIGTVTVLLMKQHQLVLPLSLATLGSLVAGTAIYSRGSKHLSKAIWIYEDGR